MAKTKKGMKLLKFRKKDIPKINYGVIHGQFGFADGVSIVMKQIEEVMTGTMDIPASNIYYLVGQSKNSSPYIRQNKILWHKHPVVKLMNIHFKDGYGGRISERVEIAISKAQDEIKKFVDEKKIDVIIAHNTAHPLNFVTAIALSRYYREEIKQGRKTPKYLLWWHDSHLERHRYSQPSTDVKRYLLQGVPGKQVEYIFFINSLQFEQAQEYLLELDEKNKGYYENILHNHTVIYNTATTTINTYDDLRNDELTERVEKFLDSYGIRELIRENNLTLGDVQFVLQHTRIVARKRIDFALRYAYALFDRLKNKKKTKAMVFFISGHHGDEPINTKKELIKLNKKLAKEYDTNKFFLVFAEDFTKKDIFFEEFPAIFARLGGVGTYFSEIEGFGNNLLEMLAGGLIPIVYTYPVFVKDIAKYKFKLVCLDKFEVDDSSLKEVIKVINSDRVKKIWANRNIKILKRNFSHEIIANKLKRGIIRRRQHI